MGQSLPLTNPTFKETRTLGLRPTNGRADQGLEPKQPGFRCHTFNPHHSRALSSDTNLGLPFQPPKFLLGLGSMTKLQIQNPFKREVLCALGVSGSW